MGSTIQFSKTNLDKPGIVSELGRLGYLTMLALDELEPELEAIASFYPVIETKLK
jgi:hypothetical protein